MFNAVQMKYVTNNCQQGEGQFYRSQTSSSDSAISFILHKMNNPQLDLDEDDLQDNRSGMQKKWNGNEPSRYYLGKYPIALGTYKKGVSSNLELASFAH